MPKGQVVKLSSSSYVPEPDRVLITTAPRDIYEGSHDHKKLPVFTNDGFLDGFAEYTTDIPDIWKFHTRQRDYGFAFLEANVPGPTFLHYPFNETIIDHLESGQYDVLCISAFTWTLPWALGLARMAKSEYGIKEVWLGGYAVMTDEPLIKKVFDRLFWGYCESLLRQSIGISPTSNEEIKHPNLITEASWLGRNTKTGHLIFRRGCPNSCTYCADPVFQPGGDYPLSINAINQILDFYKWEGIRSVYVSNQETHMLNAFGKEVLYAIKSRGLNFGMLTSFKALAFRGEDGMKELRDSGLSFLLIGLESLSDKNLEKAKRKASQELMEKTLNLLRKLNISVTSTYMICFEDDTEESIRQSKKRIIDLGITVSLFNITVPLPGTPLYYSYKEKGFINDWNWSHWTGNHLVWKHPSIAPEVARELLAEMRGEVNHPHYNPTLKSEWDRNLKNIRRHSEHDSLRI
ncbi:MAG: radical SAM protein [Firmicutes bacterium]|nr:radical SAM protein [Bacillota bacterium]